MSYFSRLSLARLFKITKEERVIMSELIGWIIIATIAISGFVGLNNDWTFNRVADRVAFYNYDKTSELKELMIIKPLEE